MDESMISMENSLIEVVAPLPSAEIIDAPPNDNGECGISSCAGHAEMRKRKEEQTDPAPDCDNAAILEHGLHQAIKPQESVPPQLTNSGHADHQLICWDKAASSEGECSSPVAHYRLRLENELIPLRLAREAALSQSPQADRPRIGGRKGEVRLRPISLPAFRPGVGLRLRQPLRAR